MSNTMLKSLAIVCVTAITGPAATAFAQADAPSAQDKQFVKEAASGGMAEVRLGEYASANASSDAVKKFGEHMVDDHKKANDKLKEIASRKGIEFPRELSDEDQKVLDRLEKLKGAEFDKAYVAQMVEDHKKDVAAFEKEAGEGTQTAVKGFAEETLPTLKHHLEMAIALQK